MRHSVFFLQAYTKSCTLVVNNAIVSPKLLQRHAHTVHSVPGLERDRKRERGTKSKSERVKYPNLRYSLIQKSCSETSPGWKCISLRYKPGNTNKRKHPLMFWSRAEQNDSCNCLFTLIWLYSDLPDSLLTGLVSALGLRTWRSGLEIGRPVILIPSEKEKKKKRV